MPRMPGTSEPQPRAHAARHCGSFFEILARLLYSILGFHRDNVKENGDYCSIFGLYTVGIAEQKMETTIVHWRYTGTMEKNMQTTMVYWVYLGIMEKNMRTTTIMHWGLSETLVPIIVC